MHILTSRLCLITVQKLRQEVEKLRAQAAADSAQITKFKHKVQSGDGNGWKHKAADLVRRNDELQKTISSLNSRIAEAIDGREEYAKQLSEKKNEAIRQGWMLETQAFRNSTSCLLCLSMSRQY